MVVVPEPAVKGCRAFGAGAVDGAVGPAAEQGADEALCLAVGLGSVGAGAQVADAERAAGERVHGRAVSGPIVGQQALDFDAVALEERHRSAQERDRGCRLLVWEHLGVGQTAAVVNRDVDELPADRLAALAVAVGDGPVVVLAQPVADALSGAALDAAKPLDVDVDQLAGAGTLVAAGGLEAETAELAHPDAREDARDRRERHAEQLGDLGSRAAQSAQAGDRLDAVVGRAVCDPCRRRGAIEQAELALRAVAADPLARAAHADFGGRGRLRQRPALLDDAPCQQPALVQAEGRVSVELHPVSSLGLGCLAAPSLQGGPDEPTWSGTTPRAAGFPGPSPRPCGVAAARPPRRAPSRRPRGSPAPSGRRPRVR